MIRVGVIGYGYWGPNLVRNFGELPGAQVAAVSDRRPERLALVKSRYPSVRTMVDHSDMLADSGIDAVAIATPISTHYDLALQALRADKHVLVEKPIAASSEHAIQLLEEAERRKKVLMVDHTFVYTGAVRKIKELIVSDTLGDIYYYDSVRVNLGLFQHDVDVIWDLAVHDLSIMDYVLPYRPCAVSATGMSHFPGQPENIAYLTLFFEEPLIAHMHVNWLAPVKVRRTLIGSSQKMIVYDDIEPSEKVKVYDKGISRSSGAESVYQMLISYRTGDMSAPQLDTTEALHTELRHFVRCIEHGQAPLTGGEVGLRIVEILEAASRSMAERGRLIEARKVQGDRMIPFLDLKAQYRSIKEEIAAAIGRVLESGQYVLGDEVAAFEREFAAYSGARYGIAVNSGTSALHLALLAAGIGPGDEVITVPFTFVATVAAIEYARARPVFVDIDPRSLTMAPDQVESAITSRTKAVMPVHLHGRPAEMEPILEVARHHGLLVIEDAAQAHGGRVPRSSRGEPRRPGLLQLLSRQEPGSLRRRWAGDDGSPGFRSNDSYASRLGRIAEVSP